MRIKKKEIKKIFWEVAICEECGGELQYTGNYVACDPPDVEMICPKCGKTEYVTVYSQNESFPRMKFEFVEEAEDEQAIKSNCNL